jgi:hypothetical protein
VYFHVGGNWPDRNLESKFNYGELRSLINPKGPLAGLLQTLEKRDPAYKVGQSSGS